MSDLTPETALAMAYVCPSLRLPSRVHESWAKLPEASRLDREHDAAETIRNLSLLGFEVRRKDATDPESKALMLRPDQEPR